MNQVRTAAGSPSGKRARKLHRHIVPWFILIIVVFLLISLIARDKTYSAREGRELTPFPRPTVASVLSGEYQENLRAYASDHFFARDFWTGTKTRVSLMFGREESGGIYKCSDNYLIQRFTLPSTEAIETQTAAINAFAAKYPDLNQYMLVAPTSGAIFADKLPAGAPMDDETAYMTAIRNELAGGVNFIDVTKALKNHKEEYLYYKTDSHWTGLGAYYAYKQAAETMQLDTSLDNFEALPVTNDFNGDLSEKSGYNRGVKDQINVYFYRDSSFKMIAEYTMEGTQSVSLYQSAGLSGNDMYDVYLGGDHSVMTIETSANTGRKLLILKDSYANCFIPFLASNFREIVVVDPSCYYGDLNSLIKEENITDLMYLYNAVTLSTDTSLTRALTGAN